MSIPGQTLWVLLLLGQDTQPEAKQGVYQGKTIEYVESDGMAIVEGDIVLGPVSMVQPITAAGKRPTAAVYRPSPQALWPRGKNGYAEIPYTVSGAGLRLDVVRAVQKFNETSLSFLGSYPAIFVPDPKQSESSVERGCAANTGMMVFRS